jgi:hypothetical protein
MRDATFMRLLTKFFGEHTTDNVRIVAVYFQNLEATRRKHH